MRKMTKEHCMQALYGGLLLGGGGGGSLQLGIDAMEEAFRHTDAITLMEVDELQPEDVIVNVSMVGAPSAKDTCCTVEHWKTALKNFENAAGVKIAGVTSCENGGVSTSNGWVISALTGIPVIDAPSNGRAHPSGPMGSIGLNALPDYQTVQAACGGKGDKYVETITKGTMNATSHMIRQTAVASGGMCCVLRNPVTAEYTKKHAALGAIAQAMEIGKAYLDNQGNVEGYLDFLKKNYDAQVICSGVTSGYSLCMDGGYDVGAVHVKDGGDDYELTYWNEYMTLEKNGERMGTFPDLLCTLDAGSGLAISSAEIQDDRNVIILKIPRERLILGAGMRQRSLFEEAEAVIGKALVSFDEALFED